MAIDASTHERFTQLDVPERESASVDSSFHFTFRDLLDNRDFVLLWIGEAISLLGDQFYLLALPWLVLKLTGDAFAMGTVLALGAIPRAVLMLVGGGLTDRFTPRRIMLYSNLVRMILVTILAVVVLIDMIQLWMLYGMALAFGIADAFLFPAGSAIVPRIVDKPLLKIGNAIIQGTIQLSVFLGPMLAGFLIARVTSMETIAGDKTVADITGIGIAFVVDAVTFIASAVTLLLMRDRPRDQADAIGGADTVWQAIRGGLQTVWDDRTLRLLFALIATGNFLIVGPLTIGIPVLADSRLSQGATALGILTSMFGGGYLIGLLLAGSLPQPQSERLGINLGVVWSLMGLGVALLGIAQTTPLAAAIILLMSTANGYVSILFMTWLQQRTPDTMQGRMMSVLMFTSMGLQPVALALAGALIELSMTGLFIVGGIAMTGIVWLALRNPTLRRMGFAPVLRETATKKPFDKE